ncbi:MAG: hypothetical protein JW990_20270 [Thermoleophilia bacterium]|nr:hypothetical protein [Thermoleophilia bacterium]
MLVVVAIGAVFLSSLAAGCGDGTRHVTLEERPGTGISLSLLWRDIAEAAKSDPSTMSLESMRLEYSEPGRLARAVIKASTVQAEHLQVFLSGRSSPDVDPLVGGVTIYAPDNSWRSRSLGPGRPIFEAMDLAQVSNMIAMLSPAGYGGFYMFVPAYEFNSEMRPLGASALAYLWNGTDFVELGPDDERREFVGGYQYLLGSTAKLVSTDSTDDQITKQWGGSGEPVYFVIPTPGR